MLTCYLISFKGNPGYKNNFILIDSRWLVKTNGATFIFIGKLGNKILPVQFWSCLSFASLSVPSGMAQSLDLSCTPKLRPLFLWYEFVWRWVREMRFEWVSSAVITFEDHAFKFKKKELKCIYYTKWILTFIYAFINA